MLFTKSFKKPFKDYIRGRILITPRNHHIVRVYNLILCGYKCCIFQIHVPGRPYSNYAAYPKGRTCSHYAANPEGRTCSHYAAYPEGRTYSNYAAYPKGRTCSHYAAYPEGRTYSNYAAYPEGRTCSHYAAYPEGNPVKKSWGSTIYKRKVIKKAAPPLPPISLLYDVWALHRHNYEGCRGGGKGSR